MTAATGNVRGWGDRWNAYWFPVTGTRDLALCRIIAVAAQLFWYFPSFHEQLNLVSKNSSFIDPQVFIRIIAAVVPRNLLFTPSAFAVIHAVTIAAGVAALIGLLTRVSLFVFALGIWFFIAHLYSYADVHHESALFLIFLLLLAFTPCDRHLSVDAILRRQRAGGRRDDRSDMAVWPLRLAHVLLAMTYFSAGASKLISGGLAWMNGYTLENYVFADAMTRGFPFGVWLAQHHTLSILLSVFTIVFELGFCVSLLLPRLAPLVFLTGIFFHIGLYAAAGHDFFPHMVLLFLCLMFLDPSWWRSAPAWKLGLGRPPGAVPAGG